MFSGLISCDSEQGSNASVPPHRNSQQAAAIPSAAETIARGDAVAGQFRQLLPRVVAAYEDLDDLLIRRWNEADLPGKMQLLPEAQRQIMSLRADALQLQSVIDSFIVIDEAAITKGYSARGVQAHIATLRSAQRFVSSIDKYAILSKEMLDKYEARLNEVLATPRLADGELEWGRQVILPIINELNNTKDQIRLEIAKYNRLDAARPK
jgi:hypothetical protein